MDDRLEFSSAYERPDPDKLKTREQLEEAVSEFLKNGGTIDKLKYSPVDEIISHVGQWVAMGDLPIGDQYDLDNITMVDEDLQ